MEVWRVFFKYFIPPSISASKVVRREEAMNGLNRTERAIEQFVNCLVDELEKWIIDKKLKTHLSD